jgi:hypothetical protein
MISPVLTVEEVSEYIRDKAENNLLIDGVEFSPTVISVAMDLAVSEYNLIPPLSLATVSIFPSKALLMSGTLYKMFLGQAALLARNTMSYSDGGISIPVEERFQLYATLGNMYQQEFQTSARALKTHLNLESGWGNVSSEYAYIPVW